IQGNIIQQGPASQNPVIIAFGEEGGVHANSVLNVTGNTILNDLQSPSAAAVWNAAGSPASVSGNSIYGLAANQVIRGAATAPGNAILAAEPALATTSPWASAAIPNVPSSTASVPTAVSVSPASSSITSAPITATTLAINLSEDAYQGDAQFIVTVDGQALGQAQPVVALSALGQTQSIVFSGNFTAGVHDLAVSFINDAWGGTAATDRNLYINSVGADGTQLGGSTGILFSNGDFHIPFTVPATTSV
ncbi:MAG TPA: carbohydrate-binding domain-containing protein, partial [Acetobacteraceae bacterium]